MTAVLLVCLVAAVAWTLYCAARAVAALAGYGLPRVDDRPHVTFDPDMVDA